MGSFFQPCLPWDIRPLRSVLAFLSEPCLFSLSPVPIGVHLFKETVPSLGLLRHIPAKPKGLGAPCQGTCQGYDPRHVPHTKSSLNTSRLANQCCPFPPCPPSSGSPPHNCRNSPRVRLVPGNVLTPAVPLHGSGGSGTLWDIHL